MLGTFSGRPPFKTLVPRYELVNGPSAEPMHITEAKQQCRRALEETAEDSWFGRGVESARYQVETDTCRSIVWQRWKMFLDRWPDVINIYKCPVREVELIRYLDLSGSDGTWQTVDSSAYTVSYTEPCRINQSYGHYWLPARFQMGSIEVTFTSGWLVPFTADSSSDTLTFIDYEPTNGDSFRLTNSGGNLPNGLLERRTYYVVQSSGNTCKLSATSGGSAIDLTSNGAGLHYLGEVPQPAMQAMRKHIAKEYADREGSANAAACEQSYFQSLRAVSYTGQL